MTKEEFTINVARNNMTIQEKTDVFNYFIKHHGQGLVYEDTHRVLFDEDIPPDRFRLSDCEIKPPTTTKGRHLLDYSIKQIRKLVETKSI